MRSYPQVNVRMPPEVVEWLKQKAEAERRSVTGQIVHILESMMVEQQSRQPEGATQ